jgi:dihydrofolate synthase/folylpolyglutamate synthase
MPRKPPSTTTASVRRGTSTAPAKLEAAAKTPPTPQPPSPKAPARKAPSPKAPSTKVAPGGVAPDKASRGKSAQAKPAEATAGSGGAAAGGGSARSSKSSSKGKAPAAAAATRGPAAAKGDAARASARGGKVAERGEFVEAKLLPPVAPRSASSRSEIGGYQAALRWLHDRSDIERMRVVRYSDDAFRLDRMRRLMERLGNPHEQTRMVHVGGTNGKGATVAMISAMLEGCGYTVGSYTSPHLIDVRERVSINGQMIGKSEFTDAIRAVAEAATAIGEQPTFFETITAVAFKHFAEQAVDIAVIEVGLGGRLDSTNIIVPEVSVITSIDLDHTRLLGASRPEIAREKAGIFKPGVPALAFDLDAPVEAAMREVAAAVGASLRVVNKEIEFSSRFCSSGDLGPHTRVCLYTPTSRLEHLPVPLPGEHQAGNCGLALAVIDLLRAAGMDCPEEKVTSGLARTRVPGRMQILHERPRVLADGAHNPAAVGALMRCVGAHVPYDSMVCVFGCCSDKDVGAMLDRVNLGADKVVFTRSSGNPRAMDPDELQRMFAERSGKMSQVGRSLPEALELAGRAVSREDLICITGSFYLVGEAIKHFAERQPKGDAAARLA